jgi:hypothetical protein
MTQDQNKTKRVAVRMTPEKKQRWEEAAEEHGFGSIAAMIRKAVRDQYIDDTPTFPDSGDAEAVQVDLSAVENQLSTLNNRMREVENTLDRMNQPDSTDDVDTSGLGDVLDELEAKLYDLLPQVAHPSELPPYRDVSHIDGEERIRQGGYLDDMISILDYGQFDIRTNLDYLVQTEDEVVEVDLHDEGTQYCIALDYDGGDYYTEDA